MRRAMAGAVAITASTAITACDSHAPVGGIPAPATYAATVTALTPCGPQVAVPAAVSGVTPQTSAGPTSVLRVGAAVAFDVPTGSRVGIAGTVEPGERAAVCTAARGGQVVLVARAPGYVRVGVVATGSKRPRLVFVKVTD